ncbi:hypothetical protein O6H91_07G015600 [Diphasiastrum complanatum]|uniref:Uncharacterized protein n=1 Tax=Diphasiastrum complanatum TaxID=34168 RepID=A0ACC2D2L3_DIPCM|nr:hypothetical protein O6H91_07G015600 [Diphasiastrum complanatum]
MESQPQQLILVEKSSNGIATITLNRPKALNALTREMMDQLAAVFRALEEDAQVKVIILTGAGQSFCAGVDLTAASEVFKGNTKDPNDDPLVQMEKCSKPIIGAINGFAVTAGFELSLACDILIADSKAKFVDTHCKFGIFPSWGLSQKLPRIIGVNRAREVSLMLRPIEAEVAERWGLVNRVVSPPDLLKAAIEIAESIIKNHEGLVVEYKAVIRDGMKLSLADGLRLEKERAHHYYANMKPEEFAAMQKFIAGRSANTRRTGSKL